MKMICLALLALSSVSAFADAPTPCETVLMSKPSCVNLINAKQFCSMMGQDQQIAETAADCIQNMSKSMDMKSAELECLAGYASSSNPADNATLCN